MYRIVRVNTKNHKTRAAAIRDMEVIIDAGHYWRLSGPINLPYGTPMIAMGSHGGRGLYLFGISYGDWEQEGDAGEYDLRIKVVWQPVIYCMAPESVDAIASKLSRWNVHSGCEATQYEFRKAMNYILKGKALDPYVQVAA
jgi:hypothetical protein